MPGAREEAWITRLAKVTEDGGHAYMRQSCPSSIASAFKSARIPIAFLARLTEILQLRSIPSMPGIPDMPEKLVLMAPEAVEVEGIPMVIDAMWAILCG